MSKYTKEACKMLSLAREEVLRLCHRLIGTEHLFLAMLRLNSPLVEGLFISLRVNPLDIARSLEFVIGRGRHALLSEPLLSVSARMALLRAGEAALAHRAERIGLEHVLLGIFAERDSIAVQVLESFGISSELACHQLEFLVANGYEHLATSIKYHALYETTPMLNLVCRDLTIEALEGQLSPLVGRVNEMERIVQVLSRRTRHNPLLIGPAGVGKTALVEGLARRIVQGDVPEHLLYSRVIALDINLLLSGTRFRGDIEDRLHVILQEINNMPGIILVIDDLHVLVQAEFAEGSLDIVQLLKPLLVRRQFRCIGATTLDEYRKNIECHTALARRFQPVHVAETDSTETLAILRALRTRYETFHRVAITDEALQAAASLSSTYEQQLCRPDNALNLVDEAAALVGLKRSLPPRSVQQLRMEVIDVQRAKNHAIALHDFPLARDLLKNERRLRKELLRADSDWRLERRHEPFAVNQQDIAEVVALRTGIPVGPLGQEEQQRLLKLEQELHQSVVGQDEAVHAVASAIRRAHTHIRDLRRPVGVFFFVGPVGVGKTELAHALATALFGQERALFQYDMSEFMEYHQVSRLLGSPPGYVGYEQGGQLTEAVRRQPYCIVLFDKIEHAHPKVLSLLLQICEDGNLTDARGLSVSFKHAIIILTSNIGTEYYAAGTWRLPHNIDNDNKYSYEKMQQRVLVALRQTFSPELLGRLDEVIVFHSLHLEHLHEIVHLLIARTRTLLAAHSIGLVVTEAACLLLVEKGYRPEYGARFLRRAVQYLLVDMLADAILQGTLSAGDVAEVDVAYGNLCLRVSRAPSRVSA